MDVNEEPLRTCLSPYPIHTILYNQNDSLIYMSAFQGIPVALKVKKYPHDHNRREASNLFPHPNIVHLFDHFSFEFQDSSLGEVLILELMEINIKREIKARRKANRPWTEAELIEFLKQVIDPLEVAQQRNISHRDIKPANILRSTSIYKITDFDLSIEVDSISSRRTLVGTKSYLSPLLLSAMERGASKVNHNCYKSDVFSLGLTLLAMCRLNTYEFRGTDSMRAQLGGLIQEVPYSDPFRSFLRLMLEYKEKHRPDFIELKAKLNQLFPEAFLDTRELNSEQFTVDELKQNTNKTGTTGVSFSISMNVDHPAVQRCEACENELDPSEVSGDHQHCRNCRKC